MPHVAHDTNDLPRLILLHLIWLHAQAHVFSQRIFILEIAVRQSLIDYDCPGRGFVVAFGQIAPTFQRNAQSVKQARTYLCVAGHWPPAFG